MHRQPASSRRLERLANDCDRLLDLYLGGDINREGFARARGASSNGRIEQGVTEIESKMGDQTQALQEGRKLVELALRAARRCSEGYRKANAETKKLWNQAFIDHVVVRDRQIVNVKWAESVIQNAGFEIRHQDNLREHYARTLSAWCANLDVNWEACVAEVGPATARVWQLCMAGSRIGFEKRNIELHQVLGVQVGSDGVSGMSLRPGWERETEGTLPRS